MIYFVFISLSTTFLNVEFLGLECLRLHGRPEQSQAEQSRSDRVPRGAGFTGKGKTSRLSEQVDPRKSNLDEP